MAIIDRFVIILLGLLLFLGSFLLLFIGVFLIKRRKQFGQYYLQPLSYQITHTEVYKQVPIFGQLMVGFVNSYFNIFKDVYLNPGNEKFHSLIFTPRSSKYLVVLSGLAMLLNGGILAVVSIIGIFTALIL